MQSLEELIESLKNQAKCIAKRNECYSLILELFLSIEDGKCASDITLQDVIVKFSNIGAAVMLADLSNDERSNCHETILQIIALCLANTDLWGDDHQFLETLLFRVCHILLNVDIARVIGESREEEVVTTALFALDNSMRPLTEIHSDLLIRVFNHILQRSNVSVIARIYAYRALMRFCTDITHESATASPDNGASLASIIVPVCCDLVCSDIKVREAAVLFLESIGASGAKALGACASEEIRQVLRFLRCGPVRLVDHVM